MELLITRKMNIFSKTLNVLKSKSGFTLIELIIVTSIMVIMILVVTQVYIMGMVQSKSDLSRRNFRRKEKAL